MASCLRNIKQSGIVSWDPRKVDVIFSRQNNGPGNCPGMNPQKQ